MGKICIIVTNYNLKAYIGRCLSSIVRQSYSLFEVIIVDDGSNDGSEDICDSYAERDKRFHVIHKNNEGLAAARNKGLRWAFENDGCKWITFIDGDDWIHVNYLEILYNAVHDSGLPVSSCKLRRVRGKCEDMPYGMDYKVESSEAVYTSFGKEVAAHACGKLFLKELFSNIVFPEGKLYEDIFVTYKVYLQSKDVAYVPLELYYYFFNTEGIVHGAWQKGQLDEFEAFDLLIKDLTRFKKWTNSLPVIKRSYVKEIYYSYCKEQKSDLSADEKQCYGKIIRKKMRRILAMYRKEANISFSEYRYVYEVAYPGLMSFYWIGVAIINKCKKKLRKK